MSPALILILIAALVVWLLARRASGKFGQWIANAMEDAVGRRVDRRVARLRNAAHTAGRPPGSPVDLQSRLYAGAIDAAGAVTGGLLLSLALGFGTTTSYYSDGTVDTQTGIDFSFWLFVLLTVVIYAAEGFRAASFSDEGQTFGQRLFDYAPRDAAGHALSTADYVKRHMLRLAAAPGAIAAMAQGRTPQPEHDRWTAASAATLGAPAQIPSA